MGYLSESTKERQEAIITYIERLSLAAALAASAGYLATHPTLINSAFLRSAAVLGVGTVSSIVSTFSGQLLVDKLFASERRGVPQAATALLLYVITAAIGLTTIHLVGLATR